MPKPQVYRDFVDSLVHACHQGQGSVASNRALNGVWNPHVDVTDDPDQEAFNTLLASLTPTERRTLSRMLARTFEAGAFEALKTLDSWDRAVLRWL